MAQSDPMSCLTDAEGLFLRWNKAWQKDKKDQGIIYRIDRITKVPGKKHFALELQSESRAAIPSRMLSVKKSSSLPSFCKNLAVEKSTLTKKVYRQELARRKKAKRGCAVNLESLRNRNKENALPFIEFKEGKWMRGDSPDYEETATCYVLGKKFSCIHEQKNKYKAQLSALEKKIRAAGSIKH